MNYDETEEADDGPPGIARGPNYDTGGLSMRLATQANEQVEENDDMVCFICSAARPCILELPCGHMNTCAKDECRKDLGPRCMICDVEAERRVLVTRFPRGDFCSICGCDVSTTSYFRPVCNVPCGCAMACVNCAKASKSPKCKWCKTPIQSKHAIKGQ